MSGISDLRVSGSRGNCAEAVEDCTQPYLGEPELEVPCHAQQLTIPRLLGDDREWVAQRSMLPDVLEQEVRIRGGLDIIHDKPAAQVDRAVRLLGPANEPDHVATRVVLRLIGDDAVRWAADLIYSVPHHVRCV